MLYYLYCVGKMDLRYKVCSFMDLFFNIVLNGIKWKIVYRIVDFPVSQTGQ